MGLLYTKMKIFHFKEKIDSLPNLEKNILPPLHIRVKPTNVCNHSCGYCAYRADNLQLGKDMGAKDSIPREKMMELIRDFQEMGIRAITFSGGGEPFMYPHLLETVQQLSKTNIDFAALTNGSRLNGEIAEIFSHHGKWLRISIDGWDDESYARYRSVKQGEFSRVMNNINNFKKLDGKCYLGISLIVNHENSDHVYSFLNRLKETGVDSVKVSPCIVSNHGNENNKYHQTVFQKVKDQVERALVELADDNFEIFDAYHELDEKFKKGYEWCPYLQILPVIGADLNIYPCQDKAYNLEEGLIGSIKNQSFKDFWYDGKDKFFKINPSKVCNHHCVANEKNKLVLEYLNADKGHLGFV